MACGSVLVVYSLIDQKQEIPTRRNGDPTDTSAKVVAYLRRKSLVLNIFRLSLQSGYLELHVFVNSSNISHCFLEIFVRQFLVICATLTFQASMAARVVP